MRKMPKGAAHTQPIPRVTLRFRTVNRDDFLAVKRGRKRVETRAATARYRGIRAGQVIVFKCGAEAFKKKAGTVRRFRSIAALLRRYRPQDINPALRSARELRERYASFPKYPEKISKHGLIAIELT